MLPARSDCFGRRSYDMIVVVLVQVMFRPIFRPTFRHGFGSILIGVHQVVTSTSNESYMKLIDRLCMAVSEMPLCLCACILQVDLDAARRKADEEKYETLLDKRRALEVNLNVISIVLASTITTVP